MKTFDEFGLDDPILKAIKELSFVEPTPVQKKAIPFIMENDRDMIALAQTGTGKTAAYGLPIIANIAEEEKIPQALVLCPTRELCIQIANDFRNFSRYIPGIKTVAVYGGANMETQIRDIKNGAHIIVATPGRMLDIIRRKKVNINRIGVLVLDEADEMLNMGFKEDLDAILSQTPDDKQTLLFSATMPPEVAEISLNYMVDPYQILIGQKNAGSANVSHQYFLVKNSDKYAVLKRIADVNPDIYGIIFCRTRMETKEIAEKLGQDGYNADALHGDLSQAQRDHVMGRFRAKKLQMLVATDVAARGIDVEDLTHIIHFSLPEDLDIYTHRSGRTGRAGKKGKSIALVSWKEKGKINRLEKVIQQKFEIMEIPSGAQICSVQLFHLIDKMQNAHVDHKKIAPFMDDVMEKLGEFSKEEIIKKFVSLEFNRFLDYYKEAKDIQSDVEKNRGESSAPRHKRPGNGRNGDRRPGGFSSGFPKSGKTDDRKKPGGRSRNKSAQNRKRPAGRD